MIKVKKLKTSFIGVKLPNIITAGVMFEDILADRGNPVDKGQGPDYPELSLEVKTKSLESRSSNVIGTMSRTNIINTPYNQSPICKKMQQQLRVKTKDGVVVKEDIFDFTPPFIQDLIKEAYNIGQTKLNVGNPPEYVNCTRYGYFEKRRHTNDSYMFRINVCAMSKLEQMSKSNYENLFQ